MDIIEDGNFVLISVQVFDKYQGVHLPHLYGASGHLWVNILTTTDHKHVHCHKIYHYIWVDIDCLYKVPWILFPTG